MKAIVTKDLLVVIRILIENDVSAMNGSNKKEKSKTWFINKSYNINGAM